MSASWSKHVEDAEALLAEVDKGAYYTEQEYHRVLVMAIAALAHAQLAEVKRVRS